MARGDFKQRVIFELVDEASGPARAISTGIGGIEKALTGIAVGGLVAAAFGQLVEFLQAGARGASEAETATVRLRAALEASAPGALAFAGALGRQAEELQKLGSLNAEAAQGVQALLANVGVGASQLELATQAAVDLSAALGIGLDAAAQQVGATLSGTAGRLSRLVPELAALSEESLRAGEGIRVLSEQFGGQAAQQATTYANSVARLSEATDGLAEAVGGGLAGEGAAAGVRNLALAFEGLAGSVQNTGLESTLDSISGSLSNLAANGVALFETFGVAIGVFEPFGRALSETAVAALEAEEALQREAIAVEQAAEAQRRATEAQAAFIESTKALGVVLEAEVGTKIEANNALLLEADELYRQGVITRRDFEAVELAIAEAERALNAELAGTSAALATSTAQFEVASEAVDFHRERVEALGASATRSTAAVVGLGNSLGIIARSAGSQALVDASIAAGNRPILGGTRIRIPGGSRLVGR